ncbi:MAG: Tim44 domain-containing protein [Rhodocyclaceae bacterium]|nr:Tim44 domain-containing protein [Rhodocyclaceae bacterium]
MKRLLIALFTVFVGFAMTIPDAEARRLGGGRSFGMQRDSTLFKKPTAPATTTASGAKSPAAAGQTPPKRSWLGPLAGLATGLGLAALLSHFGLGEEFAGLLMLALIAFAAIFILRRLFGRSAPAQGQRMGYAGGPAPDVADRSVQNFEAARPVAGGSASHADFDAVGFEREAKLNFIRLQAASDNGNLDDIRAFTTPEVYAEIAMQLQERGAQQDRTDVMELNASVQDVSEEDGRYVVSVQFSGLLREAPEAAPAPFSEVWHLIKPTTGSEGWRIAGIQQA